MWDGVFFPKTIKKVESEDTGGAYCIPGQADWWVSDVIDGYAQVEVQFNHRCVHANGEVTEPPSNGETYTYQVEVGYMEPGEVAEEIISALPDEPNLGDLINILETGV